MTDTTTSRKNDILLILITLVILPIIFLFIDKTLNASRGERIIRQFNLGTSTISFQTNTEYPQSNEHKIVKALENYGYREITSSAHTNAFQKANAATANNAIVCGLILSDNETLIKINCFNYPSTIHPRHNSYTVDLTRYYDPAIIGADGYRNLPVVILDLRNKARVIAERIKQ